MAQKCRAVLDSFFPDAPGKQLETICARSALIAPSWMRAFEVAVLCCLPVVRGHRFTCSGFSCVEERGPVGVMGESDS